MTALPTAAHPSAEPGHASFDRMWAELAPVGRHPGTGGYRRFAWTTQDATLREWFAGEAARRGLDVVTDRVGNLWAWRGDPDVAVAAGTPGLVLGSHLDSVPDGGAFDGPLGVVSSFAALDQLDAAGFRSARPLGIACFGDEEGARFGIACAGSRLLTGAMTAERGLALTDADGTTMADAMRSAGRDPAGVGRDDETLRRIGTFLELHVEQGRALGDPGHPADGPVAVGSSIWPHGRWRFDLTGRADHAGTTRLEDRHDPMLIAAEVIQQARAAAQSHGCVATVGKLRVLPNGVNAIPSMVQTWLDARGADARAVRNTVSHLAGTVGRTAIEESWTDATDFDAPLVRRLSELLGGAPVLATGAGHDAGILATAGVRTGMLFVRNPTGISHSPEEHAETDDCHAGVDALVRVVHSLAGEDA